MKQRAAKPLLIFIEIFVIILCITASTLCTYFYLFQFRQKESQSFNPVEDNIIITNYTSFKVEEKEVIQTNSVSGNLNFANDCVREIILSETTIKVGESFSCGDLLGKQGENDYFSDCIGCVIDIQAAETNGLLSLSFVDYNKADLLFSLNSTQAKLLSYDKEYDCLIGSETYKIKIKSIEYDYRNSSSISALFSITNTSIPSNNYLFDEEICSLLLEKTSQTMLSVDKNVCKYIDLSIGEQLTEVFRDENANFSYGTITIEVIGDDRIGFSSQDDILDKYLCIQK